MSLHRVNLFSTIYIALIFSILTFSYDNVIAIGLSTVFFFFFFFSNFDMDKLWKIRRLYESDLLQPNEDMIYLPEKVV